LLPTQKPDMQRGLRKYRHCYIAEVIRRNNICYRIFRASNCGPPNHLGDPGDLFIGYSTTTLWYKTHPADIMEQSIPNQTIWIAITGDCIDNIQHPSRHFHLVATPNGPTWMGYMHKSVLSYTDSVRGYMVAHREASDPELQIYFGNK
jgi:hypothetical protein